MSTSTDYEKAAKTLIKDVKELRADVKYIVSAFQGKAGGYVDSAKECVRESVADRVGQVRDAASAVEESCQHSLKGCAEKIGQRPFASLLVALGVGAILGALLKSRE